ncbi:Hypothetical predicted protein [Podarcis lilfordi]|uniref:Uncharacterized protein n=1 Tax=Podarcis lilfordi TaxID=74358 RepID=A0AA35JTP0_9SAUR|nr:Hypothetical predicted protein [Podarcis lilfordi]
MAGAPPAHSRACGRLALSSSSSSCSGGPGLGRQDARLAAAAGLARRGHVGRYVLRGASRQGSPEPAASTARRRRRYRRHSRWDRSCRRLSLLLLASAAEWEAPRLPASCLPSLRAPPPSFPPPGLWEARRLAGSTARFVGKRLGAGI